MRLGTRHPQLRTLVLPLLALGGLSFAVFFGTYLFDWFRLHPRANPLATLLDFDVDTLQNALGNMAQVVAAVLGIVITVVSIVVQLAATRYTPRIADLFFRDRTNLAVLGFFVVACIDSVWVSITVGHGFVPRISIVTMMVLVTASLLLIVPYFAYVFDFLDPDRVVGRLQKQAVAAALGDRMARRPLTERQEATLVGIEQLSDLAVNAISQKDKAIAAGAVASLRQLLVTYLERKGELVDEWFAVSARVRQNPDFISLSRASVEHLAKERVWVEWKALRQLQAVYTAALGAMPDLDHLVAIDTRYVGEAALTHADPEALALALKFFNTYLRATLNAEEVRTAYNVLHQYRLLAERAMAAGDDQRTTEIAFYLKYYGQLAHGMNLGFVTETVAYDLAVLCERALQRQSKAHDPLLRLLCELDREPESEVQEKGLRGVRKAQAKLAAFYLSVEAEPYARAIYEDMKDERPERLRSICEELLRVEWKEFWEVVDRGVNFDYLEPERREQLKIFFGWFGGLALAK